MPAEEIIPADKADSLTPADVRPTDGVAPPAAVPAADATAAARTSAPPAEFVAPRLDRRGNPFNPAKHAPGPDGAGELTTRGTWRRKGERGRPYPPKSGQPPAADDDQADDPAANPAQPPAAAEPAPSGDSFIAAPHPADPQEREGVVDPAPTYGREDYRTTAEGVTRAQFGAAQILLSSAWEPSPQEQKQWVEAWQDALAEWQAPRIGATLSLVVLLLTSTAKRRDDPATRNLLDESKAWFLGLFGRRARPASRPVDVATDPATATGPVAAPAAPASAWAPGGGAPQAGASAFGGG